MIDLAAQRKLFSSAERRDLMQELSVALPPAQWSVTLDFRGLSPTHPTHPLTSSPASFPVHPAQSSVAWSSHGSFPVQQTAIRGRVTFVQLSSCCQMNPSRIFALRCSMRAICLRVEEYSFRSVLASLSRELTDSLRMSGSPNSLRHRSLVMILRSLSEMKESCP